jgi:hypothetical protein
MRKDPFAALSGLDQELFREESQEPRTKQRNNETTLSRNNVPSTSRLNETTLSRANEPTDKRSIETTNQRLNEATRSQAAPLPGQTGLGRVSERHSHDIFHDQVRWMNRAKLEVEERYGRRVTVNALVQLAVDLLRADYEVNKTRSNIVRVLVRGEPLSLAAPEGGGG